MRLILIRIFLICIFTSQASAQSDTGAITLGDRYWVESSVLGEAREIWISTPASYTGSEEHYPVLFLLDGDSHFRHASASAQQLAESARIPESIVVAILNVDRGRDFTPPSEELSDISGHPTLGGAENFLQFLSSELLPFVDDNYRTRPYKILMGHSLGGLFALHTLFTEPETFNAYIALDPTMRWNDQVLVSLGEEFVSSNEELSVDLYLASANEVGDGLGGLRKIAGILTEETPKDFRWEFRHMPEESHNSVPVPGTYYGLKSIFQGWSLGEAVAVYEFGGLEAIENYYVQGGDRFGYERTMPATLILQIAMDFIATGRLDDAATLVTEDFGAPPPSFVLNRLAESYAENGDLLEARQYFEMSLASNPTDIQAREKLVEMGIDISELIAQVQVSEETLSRYEGRYRVLPDFELRIYLDGTTLYQQGTGQRSARLVPVSETRFSVEGSDSRLEFFTGDDSKANRLTLHQFGREIEAPRIE